MVTRVWGKADSFELVFSPLGASGEQWEAKVPTDLEDGQYAVELYCCDEAGSMAYWTGMLYLNNSASVKVRIVADKLKLWFEVDDMKLELTPESGLTMEPETEVILCGELQASMEDERIKLTCSVDRG